MEIKHDNLETIGDIVFNLDYWDCECGLEYIHSNDQEYCELCGAYRDEQPYSRDNEVKNVLEYKGEC